MIQQHLRRRHAGEAPGHGPQETRQPAHPWPGPRRKVQRFGRRATESFESLHIRIPSKFFQKSSIQENFSELFRNSENFRKSQRFLEYSAKFREIFIKICANFVQNYRKKLFFAEIQRKIQKSLTNFCEDFEFGAVRRSVYLVAFEKRFKKCVFGCKNRR